MFTEHAARQFEPDEFVSLRSFRPQGFPRGVRAILGIREERQECALCLTPPKGRSVIQSLRFDAALWTPEQAGEWCRGHNFKDVVAPNAE